MVKAIFAIYFMRHLAIKQDGNDATSFSETAAVTAQTRKGLMKRSYWRFLSFN